MATQARLYGLNPPPIRRCRVLELGCADGGNLLPMAVALPDSEFVGVDYAPRQVAAGQEVVDALGLRNVSLQAQDVRTLGEDLGQFDYIIAYGIYSWVPPDVQAAILRLCRERLTPQGVAFVSYNTYPGWHLRAMVREMLVYHVRDVEDLGQQVAYSRDFLDFLVDSTEALRQRFGKVLHFEATGAIVKAERDQLQTSPDFYLAHELLEEVNAPVYFHEFVERAAQHGLQYLAEAEFSLMQLDNLPEPVADALRRFSDSRIAAEQYLDFLYNRTFRQTLLCHAGVDLEPTPAAIASLALTGRAEPESASPDLAPGAVERFRGPTGTVVWLNTPLGKAALLELHATRPQALPFWELLRRARTHLGQAPETESGLDDPDTRSLAQQLLHWYALDLVELHSDVPAFTLEISTRPVACPLARNQALRGVTVANRRHEPIRVEDGLTRHVLTLLDGSRDRAGLLAELSGHAATAGFERAESAAGSDAAPAQDLSGALDEALRVLAGSALLIQ